MKYSLSEIAKITKSKFVGSEQICKNICFDSRQLLSADGVLFIALKGVHFDGHSYLEECYSRGVRAFIVDSNFNYSDSYKDAGFVVCDDSLKALQLLAAHHRSLFSGTLIAIIGSNGKSSVKEIAAQLYDSKEPLFRSPKSYNSQIGVALSLLMIKGDEKLAIIEAGISKLGEMETLTSIIKPDVVLLTNIGDAHSENFSSREEKLLSKLTLAKQKSCKKLIYKASSEVSDTIESIFDSEILCPWREQDYSVDLPFEDAISRNNIFHAITLLKECNAMPHDLQLQCSRLQRISMRMELRRGQCDTQIINDSYNSDFGSLQAALQYMQSITNEGRGKIVILSDIFQSGLPREELYQKVSNLLKEASIDTLIAVGDDLTQSSSLFEGINSIFYNDVDSLLRNIKPKEFAHSTILLKGSRLFAFERVLKAIELKHHNTILEVNLDNMLHNLNFYRSKVEKRVKIMAMVKARSYGNGTWEIARALEGAHIDYLAVAYADEGVELRENGVTTPIVVLGSDPFSHRSMIEHNLEPEIYSVEVLIDFINECRAMAVSHYPIHIKIDSGMRRVGFKEENIDKLIEVLKISSEVKVKSIFSHLAASDIEELKEFTEDQIATFEALSSKIISNFNYKIDRHICNSSAIARYRDSHYDMVRLGIGLYGFGADREHLLPISTLKSVIVQISNVKKGETIGYNRAQTATKELKIATIAIGYADGLRRSLGCGNWSVEAAGKTAPIVGNICMDSTMIDITDIDINVGDYVTIFGEQPSIEDMAQKLSTIEYEIMTDISPRIKRTFIKD